MALDPLIISNGVLMLILDAISLTVGFTIFSKYFKYKQIALAYVGLAWIFIACPWYPGAISFIMFLLTQQYLGAEVYMIIGNVFIPIALVLWIAGFTELLYKNRQKLLVILFVIYAGVFYILFFYLLNLDPLLIGEVKNIDVKYADFIVLYSLTVLAVVIITGIMFTNKSVKDSNPEIRLKSKFLLLAFILYTIGTSLDALLGLDYFTLIIFRGFEISAAISFYLGFILPERVKKLFLK